MKFLLDENISQTLTRNLRNSGFEVIHVIEAKLNGASDEKVLEFARKKKIVIITHDKDFGNLIRFPLANHYGVILLRFRNQKPDTVFPYLIDFIKKYKNKNLKYRLIIINEWEYHII